jgi:hypothetical protein
MSQKIWKCPYIYETNRCTYKIVLENKDQNRLY